MDAISIIVPVYNTPVDFFDRCVTSLVNQTYKNIQIVLVDDGSQTETAQYCDEWATKDSRILVFHQKNSGVSSARNLGIEKSTGEWLTMVDSDDFLETTALEKAMSFCDNCDILIFDGKIIKNSNAIENPFFEEKQRSFENSQKDILQLQMICRETLSGYKPKYSTVGIAWGKIYKRSLIVENNIRYTVGMKMAEDHIFNLNAFEKAKKVNYIQNAGYNYIDADFSVCNRFHADAIDMYSKRFFETEKFIEQNNKTNGENGKSFEKAIDLTAMTTLNSLMYSFVFAKGADKKRVEQFKQLLNNEKIQFSLKRLYAQPISKKRKLVVRFLISKNIPALRLISKIFIALKKQEA